MKGKKDLNSLCPGLCRQTLTTGSHRGKRSPDGGIRQFLRGKYSHQFKTTSATS